MTTLFQYPSIFLLALFIPFLTAVVLSLTQDDHDQSHGSVLTVDMIHRDSPASPIYNPSETHWQRLSNALRRSHHRRHGIHRFGPEKADEEVPLIFAGGEYLVNISIGTPPRRFIGIVDSGSDLIWTQCIPCKGCFKQGIPLFNPASSPTYQSLPCTSQKCHLLKEATCSSKHLCHYNYTYGDGSYTSGDLSIDTITLNSLPIPGIIFGCGHQNTGIFSGVESGIVGLGSGAVSFVSQIGKSVGGRYFSHCLVPTMSTLSNPKITSKMYFGGKVSGPGVVSTPLLSNGSETYYYLELQGISVGGNRLHANVNGSRPFKGNVIIDSGTPVTFLPTDLYTAFEAEIRKDVHLKVVEDPSSYFLNLCYKTTQDIANVTVTVHLKGADVKLKPKNTFLRVREDIVCLALNPTNDVGIFGNIAMTNFLVGYDLENKILSFKPTDCTYFPVK